MMRKSTLPGFKKWNRYYRNNTRMKPIFKGFGTHKSGHIGFQNHGDTEVWYRNIKIREIK